MAISEADKVYLKVACSDMVRNFFKVVKRSLATVLLKIALFVSIYFLLIRPKIKRKKIILVSRNRPGEFFLMNLRPHSRMCMRLYIFKFKKQQTNNNKKNKNQKKQKKLMKKREYLRKID